MQIISHLDRKLDLSTSLLNEERPIAGDITSTGAIAFDDDFRILPHISTFLSLCLRDRSLSVKTAKTYGSNLLYLLRYVRGIPEYQHYELDDALLHITEFDIRNYFNHLNTVGISQTTIRNRDAAYLAFFSKYLCIARGNSKELRSDNPYEGGLLSPKPKDKLVVACDLAGLLALLEAAEYERERCIIQFAYDSGCRSSEIAAVKLRDITEAFNSNKKQIVLDNKLVEVPRNYIALKINGVKGRRRQPKERFTIVSLATMQRIQSYHSSPLFKRYSRKYGDYAPAFLNAEGEQLSSKSVGKMFKKLSNRALKSSKITSAIHPHMMRHGFAYSVLQSPDLGISYLDRLIVLQKALGHSSIKSTEIYTKIPQDIYARFEDSRSNVVYRCEIMKMVADKTRLKIDITDKR